MMKLLILGASGRTGKLLLDDALNRGYLITALVRNPGKMPVQHQNLTYIQGSPYNLPDIEKAMMGNQVVIVALNNPRSSDAPWSKLLGEPDIISRSVSHIITAAKKHPIQRIVVLSSYGVGDSFETSNWIMRFVIRNTNMKIVIGDHNEAEKLLRQSTLNWTTARPAVLTDDDVIKPLRVEEHSKLPMSAKISRKMVARFMLDNLESNQYSGKTPAIWEA